MQIIDDAILRVQGAIAGLPLFDWRQCTVKECARQPRPNRGVVSYAFLKDDGMDARCPMMLVGCSSIFEWPLS